jgi:ribosomal protein S18 acetylase RimI-like enzyme
VGVAGLGFQDREKVRHKCTLFGMYVRDTHRHGGLGRALAVAVLDAAREREGVALVQLTVTHGNQAAEALYRQLGFIAFGTEPMAVVTAEGHVAKVHMWRPLAG